MRYSIIKCQIEDPRVVKNRTWIISFKFRKNWIQEDTYNECWARESAYLCSKIYFYDNLVYFYFARRFPRHNAPVFTAWLTDWWRCCPLISLLRSARPVHFISRLDLHIHSAHSIQNCNLWKMKICNIFHLLAISMWRAHFR